KVAQEIKATREKEIRRGLGSLFPLREIPIELAADFINFPEAGSCVLVNAQIATGSLNFRPAEAGINRTRLDLMVVIFDEQGKIATSFGDSVNLDIKQIALDPLSPNGIRFHRVLPLKPGFYQARIAVREDSSSLIGSATRWVEIPDLSKKQLALSSILLTTNEEKKSQNPQKENKPDAPYEMQVTSVNRKFKRDTSFDFLVFAYNARSDKTPPDLVIQPQVFAGSKLVLATPLAKMN